MKDRTGDDTPYDLVSRATPPVLPIFGEVDQSMLRFVYEAMNRLALRGNPDIEVRIMSPGGNGGAGLDVYDFLKMYPGKKTGVVYSTAFSAAALILQACERRLCPPHGSVLIHDPYILPKKLSLNQLESESERAIVIADLKKGFERTYLILEKRTKKTREEIAAACARNIPMSAGEALAFGLIDEIIETV